MSGAYRSGWVGLPALLMNRCEAQTPTWSRPSWMAVSPHHPAAGASGACERAGMGNARSSLLSPASERAPGASVTSGATRTGGAAVSVPGSLRARPADRVGRSLHALPSPLAATATTMTAALFVLLMVPDL